MKSGRVIISIVFLLVFWAPSAFSSSQGERINSNATVRWKRIVLGDANVTLPTRPLPIGNLSGSLGEAVCYFLDSRFYCFGHFLASHSQARDYCLDHKMKLLSIQDEEEHEYLFEFLSNHWTTAGRFLSRDEMTASGIFSDEDYSAYVESNLNVGMLVRCLSVCGHRIRPGMDEGRVLDYEHRDYIGLAVKVQWPTGLVRWYPASNLQLVGYHGTKRHQRPEEGILSLEESIFEPGDRVRLKSSNGEVGILSDLDGQAALVRFPTNPVWRGLLDELEIVNKRKASGSYWTSGRLREDAHHWHWEDEEADKMDFTNWAPEEPASSHGKGCLEIKYHRNGEWFSASCNKQNFLICEHVLPQV